MNFCQKCGTMILHGTKCPSCGADINDFDFKKLNIGIPKEYIYDKTLEYNELLDLILNRNQLDLSESDILKHSDEIIDTANENFINNEKNLISKDFKEELNSYNFIDDKKRLFFKSLYNKDYFSYYDNLNFDNQINNHNDKFINNKKKDILKNLPNKYISYSEMCEYQKENDISFEIDSIIEEHNKDFIEEQMKLEKSYFENINGISLDDNQIIAVLTDDDNTQIVAGAGTGKTLTLQAKVKYLIEKQGVAPEDILCISFSNSARDDLARKLKQTIGDAPVDVRTFHSLGFSILGRNDESREVPKHTISDLIDKYLTQSIVENQFLIKMVVEFFAYYFNLIFINETDLKLETLKSRLSAIDEYDEYLSEYLQIRNFKRNREYMGSVKELIVANYLFIHNIDYDYSKQLILKDKNYDKYVLNFSNYLFGNCSKNIPGEIKLDFINEIYEDFACEKFDEYPNFFLPKKDLYIDLKSNNNDWKTTLSKEKRQVIENSLEERKNLNKSHKSKILTIFNNENIEEFIKTINETLKNNEICLNELDYEFLFDKLISQNNPEYNRFKKTIERFINLFKGNAINVDYLGNDISKEIFDSFLIENHDIYSSNSSLEKRNKFFLNIISKIYQCYFKYLEGKYIDFDDMINDAVVSLRKGAYIYNYKYVIVDEYQDTSHTRYNLLKEIKNATGAKIVVVGDDWQSIYGFTGCDVGLFSQFEKYFDNPKMIKIDITRRNCQKLIDVVGEFIQENENQIPKELKSDDVRNYLPIKLFEYNTRAEEVLALINILDKISKEKIDAKVLILGRNNKDIYDISCREIFTMTEFNDYTQIQFYKNHELNIEYRTVHKSKGLEADYVVVLNLNNQINGFPNKIVNDPILDFVNNIEDEGIEYPEERRLFYVALTRTKNDVYLFARSSRPSVFVNDIKNKDGVEKLNYAFSNEDIIIINALLEKRFDVIETNNVCPKCKKGQINLIVNNERGTSYFRCSNFCGWEGAAYHNNEKDDGTRKISYVKYAEVCPKCGGMLIVKRNRHDGSFFLGCTSFNKGTCRKTKSLPYFEESNEDILNILNFTKITDANITRFGSYYMSKYIPQDKYDDYDKVDVDFSKRLLGYKDDEDDYSVNLFTKDLMKYISYISNNEFNENISKLALIAVPSSKVYKTNNSIKKSIDIIEFWQNQGDLETDFGCTKEIINHKDLLKRVKDVPTAHLGEGRANSEQHIDSIECMEKELSNECIAYLILDDITTTGETMKACNEILRKNGVETKNIYNIAIGATVGDGDEEI